jgi:hypothetical protein
MALTNTKASKTFIAGAPDIILKGDYRPEKPQMKMASAPDMMDELNDLSLKLFRKTLNELTDDEREQLDEFTRGLMAQGGRAQYGLGSLVKSVGKAVKGVVKGAGKVLKSPLGLLALNFAPMAFGAKPFIGMGGGQFNIPGMSGIKDFFTGGSKAMNALKIGGAGSVITGLLAEREQQEGESDIDYSQRRAQVNDQLKIQFSRLYPKGDGETPEDYDVRINALVEGADDQTVDVGNMAAGGRVGRAFGSDKLVEQASGIEGLPVNMNSKGVKELDMRETGGFIPPVGVKEKADDIPAMLSNNEFVFTADAVRAAGGGSVNKGAQRMYDLMKNLESKVG